MLGRKQKLALPMLYGDNVRLKQLLVSLVHNSLNICTNGVTRIRACYVDFSNLLKVQVAQYGGSTLLNKYQGQGEDDLDDDPNSEDFYKGLSVSKEIAKQLGGKLEVYSAGNG